MSETPIHDDLVWERIVTVEGQAFRLDDEPPDNDEPDYPWGDENQ